MKFSDIYLYQIGKFMYLFKRSLLPNDFRICLLSQAKYILIIQEIPTFSIYLIVELIFESSQFGFKVLRFSTRLVVKFKTVKVSVCLAKFLLS